MYKVDEQSSYHTFHYKPPQVHLIVYAIQDVIRNIHTGHNYKLQLIILEKNYRQLGILRKQ